MVKVVTSWFVGSSPTWGSELRVQSLLGILCPCLSAPPPAHTLCLKIKKINIKRERERRLTGSLPGSPTTGPCTKPPNPHFVPHPRSAQLLVPVTKGHKMLAGPSKVLGSKVLWLLSFLQTPECGLALSLSHTQPLLGTGGQAGLREPPRQHHTCSHLVSFLLSFYTTLETLAGLRFTVSSLST